MHCCILLDLLCELYYDARIHKHQVSSCLSTFIFYTWQIQVCRHSVFQCGSPVGGSIVVDQAELSQKRAYTCIGLYRGNIVAIKPLYKRSIDITRNIRKELKQVCFTFAVSVQQLHILQPSTYAKPEAASAVLGS